MAPSACFSAVSGCLRPGGSLAYRRKNLDGAKPFTRDAVLTAVRIDPTQTTDRKLGRSGRPERSSNARTRRPGIGKSPRPEAETKSSPRRHDVTTCPDAQLRVVGFLGRPGVHNSGQAPDERALQTPRDVIWRGTPVHVGVWVAAVRPLRATTEDWKLRRPPGKFGDTRSRWPWIQEAAATSNLPTQRGRASTNGRSRETTTGKGKGSATPSRTPAEAGGPMPSSSQNGDRRHRRGVVLRMHKDFTTSSKRYLHGLGHGLPARPRAACCQRFPARPPSTYTHDGSCLVIPGNSERVDAKVRAQGR